MGFFKPKRRYQSAQGARPGVRKETYGKNWFSLVKEIRERDTVNGRLRCLFCNRVLTKKDRIETHHLRPLSRGGTNTKANLASICEDCHNTRHPHLMKARGRF